MPKVNGLVEAALFVSHLQRARDFYQPILGLQTLQESDAGCVFVVGSGQLLLLVSKEKAAVPSETPGGEVPPCLPAPGEAGGAGHVAFAVAAGELDPWRTHLHGKGVTVLNEVAWEGGARSLYFRDPDGHLLEMATPGLWRLDWQA